MEAKMFCFQCQEAAKGTGCTIKGVCGKDDKTANRMDLLLFVTKGIATVATMLHNAGIETSMQVGHFTTDALFSTITNANFDIESITKRIIKGLKLRNELIAIAKKENITLPIIDELVWNGEENSFEGKSQTVGVLREANEDIRSLKELTIYGLKGMAAYVEHAANLGYEEPELYLFIQRALADTLRKDLSAEQLTSLVLETGSFGVKAMALLDKANTSSYGNPEITHVNIGVRNNPAILISGHDLKDMEELLAQTEGTGIDIYTHSEMLPANYYPAFKKYKHFVGNYGNAWWKQRESLRISTDRSCSRPTVSFPHLKVPAIGTVSTPPILPDSPDGNIFRHAKTAKQKIFPKSSPMPNAVPLLMKSSMVKSSEDSHTIRCWH